MMYSHITIIREIRKLGVLDVGAVEIAMKDFLTRGKYYTQEQYDEWMKAAKVVREQNKLKCESMYEHCALHWVSPTGRKECTALDQPLCLTCGKCNFFLTKEKMEENIKLYGDGSDYEEKHPNIEK